MVCSVHTHILYIYIIKSSRPWTWLKVINRYLYTYNIGIGIYLYRGPYRVTTGRAIIFYISYILYIIKRGNRAMFLTRDEEWGGLLGWVLYIIIAMYINTYKCYIVQYPDAGALIVLYPWRWLRGWGGAACFLEPVRAWPPPPPPPPRLPHDRIVTSAVFAAAVAASASAAVAITGCTHRCATTSAVGQQHFERPARRAAGWPSNRRRTRAPASNPSVHLARSTACNALQRVGTHFILEPVSPRVPPAHIA